ncbi:hypothetical protein Scep_023581 [Stephania cephalantha]|uniref:Uncharacterized protein n=1 Tax=Stephania cephalantha TaxID=152367 RepID=A0AAP0EVZ3_9MAGN
MPTFSHVVRLASTIEASASGAPIAESDEKYEDLKGGDHEPIKVHVKKVHHHSSSGGGHGGGGDENGDVDVELWRACVGPLVTLPHVGDVVYYIPQGHPSVLIGFQLATDASLLLFGNILLA